jgi:hypothetical protein
MNLGQLLIGCVLALGGIGVASATGVDTQDLISGQRATVDTMAGHEGGGSLDVSPAHDSSVSEHDVPVAGNSGGAGTATVHPQGTHRSLGWQSLLPGSIQ